MLSHNDEPAGHEAAHGPAHDLVDEPAGGHAQKRRGDADGKHLAHRRPLHRQAGAEPGADDAAGQGKREAGGGAPPGQTVDHDQRGDHGRQQRHLAIFAFEGDQPVGQRGGHGGADKKRPQRHEDHQHSDPHRRADDSGASPHDGQGRPVVGAAHQSKTSGRCEKERPADCHERCSKQTSGTTVLAMGTRRPPVLGLLA